VTDSFICCHWVCRSVSLSHSSNWIWNLLVRLTLFCYWISVSWRCSALLLTRLLKFAFCFSCVETGCLPWVMTRSFNAPLGKISSY
jgi:hypothetical protein